MVLRVCPLHSRAILPERRTAGAAGYDLFIPDAVDIPPHSLAKIPLGWKIAIPEGCFGSIRSRSGRVLNSKVEASNAGVIDSDYRGEVAVLLWNLSDATVHFGAGDAIAQLIIQVSIQSKVVKVESLDQTERGEGGFGSTDRKRDSSPDRAPTWGYVPQ